MAARHGVRTEFNGNVACRGRVRGRLQKRRRRRQARALTGKRGRGESLVADGEVGSAGLPGLGGRVPRVLTVLCGGRLQMALVFLNPWPCLVSEAYEGLQEK